MRALRDQAKWPTTEPVVEMPRVPRGHKLYEDWPAGRLESAALALANRNLAPPVALDGTTINLSVYFPWWLPAVPEHKAEVVSEALCEGMCAYARENRVDFRGYPASAHGLAMARATLCQLECGLRARDSDSQFWLCLARALGVEHELAIAAARGCL